jgi:hypothetical protein
VTKIIWGIFSRTEIRTANPQKIRQKHSWIHAKPKARPTLGHPSQRWVSGAANSCVEWSGKLRNVPRFQNNILLVFMNSLTVLSHLCASQLHVYTHSPLNVHFARTSEDLPVRHFPFSELVQIDANTFLTPCLHCILVSILKRYVFWPIMPSSPVNIKRCFEGIYCIQFQGRNVSQARHRH